MKRFFLISFFFLLLIPFFASALVSVSPLSHTFNACPGDALSINISLSGVADVYAFQYDLAFDADILKVIDINNSFLLTNYGQYGVYCFFSVMTVPDEIIEVKCTRIGEPASTDPNGILSVINFNLKNISSYPQTAAFNFINVNLTDINNVSLDNNSENGQLIISSCCADGEIKGCILDNSCTGNMTCAQGIFGLCISEAPYFCDSNCDGTSECVAQNCSPCGCIGSEQANCTSIDGCTGTKICANGTFGNCTKTPTYRCDANCDGTRECFASDCTPCECTGSGYKSCDTSGGCNGRKYCTDGNWTECQIMHYYCDFNCDGTNDTCSDEPCFSPCVCVEDWNCEMWSDCTDGTQARSCTDSNACDTDQSKPPVSRTCTAASAGPSSGIPGSSQSQNTLQTQTNPPSACIESWSCDEWLSCQTDGFIRRTCSDANICGTFQDKPQELQTCIYEGRCDDGIMNRDELGVDCGGSCPMVCLGPEPEQVILGPPILKIVAEPVIAEILDQYILKVIVENQGESEANDLSIVAGKWGGEPQSIQSIMPGTSEQRELVLSLPPSLDENSLDIQLSQNDAVIDIQSIPVTLSVPEFSVKINKDIASGRTYESIIVDNRNSGSRTVEVDVTINKGRETYLFDFDKAYDLAENEIFNNVDYLYEELPDGKYEINSVFYENGQKIGEATSYAILSGGNKSVNVQYLFYLLLLAIVGASGYIFFMNQKKLKGELRK